MVSRKTAWLGMGAAVLLGACQSKQETVPAAQADMSNTSADNAGMMEAVGNGSMASNDSTVMTEAAPAPIEHKRGKRGNSDTRGSPSSATTTK